MKYFYNLLIVLTIPAFLILMSYSGGSPGGKSGSPGDNYKNCTQCHSGSAQNMEGLISSNIPETGYAPGETYEITVSADISGINKYGFEITAEDSTGNKVGTFVITETSRTRFTNANHAVTHKSAGTIANNNSISWNMQWIAPAEETGKVSFYVALNATNANGSTSGDHIYLNNITYNEEAVDGIAENTLKQIELYPNPASEILNIKTEENSQVFITDMSGRTVYSTVSNKKLLTVNVSGFENGVYVVTVLKDGKKSREKVLIF